MVCRCELSVPSSSLSHATRHCHRRRPRAPVARPWPAVAVKTAGRTGGAGGRAARRRHAARHRRGQHVHRARRLDDHACAARRRSWRRPRAARGSRSSTSHAKDADAAVAAAWAAYKPARSGRSSVASDAPDQRRLVEAAAAYDYETSPNEKRAVVRQRARRQRRAGPSSIYDMDEAVGEKRGAQVAPDLRPPAAEGLPARDVRRQDRAHARPGAARRADRSSSRRRAKALGVPGRRARHRPGRQGRVRRRLRRARARQARARSTPTRCS